MVSVIVPVYNVEDYIKRCVDSVLRQSYDNIELILIDDGSTDKCPDICKAYEKKDSRVRYIRKDNEGIGVTRYRAVQYVRGEYFLFVDSDDYLSNSCIELLLNNMNEDVDCVVGQHKRFSKQNGVKQVSMQAGTFCFDDGHRALADEALNSRHGVEQWNKLYRTALARQAWTFPVSVQFGEDVIYTMLYLNRCRKIKCIEETTYFYEYREGSVARSSKGKMILTQFADMTEKMENAFSGDDNLKKLFTAFAGHIYSVALTKYTNDEDGKARTIQDVEALADKDAVLRYAKSFLKNKKKLKGLFSASSSEYYQILGLYESVLHRDAFYYTRLYPARLENNKLYVLKAWIKKLVNSF